MKTFALVAVALCALSSAAHARDLPSPADDATAAYVGGFNTPVEMVLSKSFLAKAEAAAAAAHKLPYSNPFTGMCQPSEMKVSIGGIPGKAKKTHHAPPTSQHTTAKNTFSHFPPPPHLDPTEKCEQRVLDEIWLDRFVIS